MTALLVASLQALPPAGHSFGACALLRGFTRTAEGRRPGRLLHDERAVEAVHADALSDDVHVARVRVARMLPRVGDRDEDGRLVQDAHGGCSQVGSPPSQGKRKPLSEWGERGETHDGVMFLESIQIKHRLA